MSNTWDWNKALPSWDFYKIQLDGYPSWERGPDGEVGFVYLRLKKGKTKSSRDIAIAFDDIAQGNFYYRDHTDSSMPWLDKDEIYHSSFLFAKQEDKDRFLELYGEYIASGTV